MQPQLDNLAARLAEPALARHGRHLTAELLLEIGEAAWLLSLHNGRLAALGTGPFLMPRSTLALRITGEGFARFAAPRIATRNTHGTGCTLSSAVAAGLAKGLTLREAVGAAKDYIAAAIAASDTLSIGRGHGPVHHFHGLWTA